MNGLASLSHTGTYTYRKWNAEPNNYLGSEDCAAISQTGGFNDVPCLNAHRFICEMQTEGKDIMDALTLFYF